MELAHGGRGHSSSRDRYSSYSSGRSGRGGVSRRSEFRGVYFTQYTCTFVFLLEILCLLNFLLCHHVVLVSGLPPSASWQDLKVSISVDQLVSFLDYMPYSVCMYVYTWKGVMELKFLKIFILNNSQHLVSGSHATSWGCLFFPSFP